MSEENPQAAITLTTKEREYMTHALGMQSCKPGYRNHFAVTRETEADAVWQGLVAKKLATFTDWRGSQLTRYCVTLAGVRLLGLDEKIIQWMQAEGDLPPI